MNNTLKILYILFFSLSSISLLTSIFIFFKLRIKEVIQDLNGTIARKQIEIMRERNQNSINFGAGLLDVDLKKIGKTGRIGNSDYTVRTEKKYKEPISIRGLQNQVCSFDSSFNGTTALGSNSINNQNFVLIKNIVFINTSEMI